MAGVSCCRACSRTSACATPSSCCASPTPPRTARRPVHPEAGARPRRANLSLTLPHMADATSLTWQHRRGSAGNAPSL
eukprot:5027442-Prymnesium_polylepis.1